MIREPASVLRSIWRHSTEEGLGW